jgi:hypothetical protein
MFMWASNRQSMMLRMRVISLDLSKLNLSYNFNILLVLFYSFKPNKDNVLGGLIL